MFHCDSCAILRFIIVSIKRISSNRQAVDGLSATHKVNGDDEWLCEAYMKTDYSNLSEQDFQKTINEYLAYLVKEGNVYES